MSCIFKFREKFPKSKNYSSNFQNENSIITQISSNPLAELRFRGLFDVIAKLSFEPAFVLQVQLELAVLQSILEESVYLGAAREIDKPVPLGEPIHKLSLKCFAFRGDEFPDPMEKVVSESALVLVSAFFSLVVNIKQAHSAFAFLFVIVEIAGVKWPGFSGVLTLPAHLVFGILPDVDITILENRFPLSTFSATLEVSFICRDFRLDQLANSLDLASFKISFVNSSWGEFEFTDAVEFPFLEVSGVLFAMGVIIREGENPGPRLLAILEDSDILAAVSELHLALAVHAVVKKCASVYENCLGPVFPC